MSTWTTIFPDVDGPPVRSDPDEFARAGTFFSELRDSSQAISNEFDKIKTHGVSEMTGRAARAFVGVVEEVKSSLDTLPRVTSEVADLLTAHTANIDRLLERAQTGTDSALARARLDWNAKNDADDDYRRHADTTTYYQRRLDDLPPAGTDPAADADRTDLTNNRNTAANRRDSAADTANHHQNALDALRREWDELRTEEEHLSTTLDRAIDDIELADLSDPGLLSSIISGAFELALTLTFLDEIADFLHSFAEAFVAGLDGEGWGDFLWLLSDALGNVLTALAVVALIINPTALIFFVIVGALAVMKMAVDTQLYTSQTIDPRTGHAMSGLDYGINMAGSIVSLGGAAAGASAQVVRGASSAAAATGSSAAAGSSSAAISSTGVKGGVSGLDYLDTASNVADVIGISTAGALHVAGLWNDAGDAFGSVGLPSFDLDFDPPSPTGASGFAPIDPTGVVPLAGVHVRPVIVDIDIDIDIPAGVR